MVIFHSCGTVYQRVPSGNFLQFAMENCHQAIENSQSHGDFHGDFPLSQLGQLLQEIHSYGIVIFPLNMVIFHSLPEGRTMVKTGLR